MKPRLFDYIYIVLTIFLTIYGQLMLKFRIGRYGALPTDTAAKIKFLILLLLDPGILSCFIAGFLASLTWMAAMTKFDLSHAYPFISLNLALVLILSVWLLHEPLTFQKVLGVALIMLGTFVISRE